MSDLSNSPPVSHAHAPDMFTLLMPPGVRVEESPRTGPRFRVVRAPRRAWPTGRNSNLDKLTWEQWGVAREAEREHAHLLHSPYLSAPLVGSTPTVVTAHDMIPWVLPGYGGSPQVRLYLSLAAAAVKRARLILADSDASRRDVIRVLKVPSSRVRTVYLGVEPQPHYSREELDQLRSRFGLPRDFAFYLGGFDRRKNVTLLLRAWRGALADLGGKWCEPEKAVLAVGGAVPAPGGVFPDVRAEASALGLSGSDAPVRFLGRVSESDKHLLMAAARIFVYPSSYEGFGLDPLDAMSAGCPVVSSSGGSLGEVVGDAGLLVPPDDEGALCRAIVRTWTDPALRAELSRKGEERAASFTWRRTAEQTRSLYSLALNRAWKNR